MTVFVSIPPQLEAARRIGGPEVRVEVLIPPGMNPENYQLDIRTFTALGAARAVFLIGLPLEISLRQRLATRQPDLLLVDTRAGMTLRNMEGQPCQTDGQTPAAGADPHVWLDIENMIVHAQHLQRSFSLLQPPQAKQYRERAEGYIQELRALHRQLQETLAPYIGRQVLVVHPAFGYFLAQYGLRQLALEEEGKEPGPRQLQEFLQAARNLNSRVIFTQPQFSDQIATRLARHLAIEVAPLDPLPAEYCAGLREIARQLQQSWTP